MNEFDENIKDLIEKVLKVEKQYENIKNIDKATERKITDEIVRIIEGEVAQ